MPGFAKKTLTAKGIRASEKGSPKKPLPKHETYRMQEPIREPLESVAARIQKQLLENDE